MLSSRSRHLTEQGISTGKAINLLTNDVNRLDIAVALLHCLWVGPIQLLVAVLILYYIVGPSGLIALCIVLYLPLQGVD